MNKARIKFLKMHTTLHRTVLVAALAVAAFTLLGCGGGGDSSNISKAALLKKGDKLCRKIEQRRQIALQEYVGEHAPKPGSVLSRKDLIPMVKDVGMPPVQEEAEQLRELGTPNGAAGEEAAEIVEELKIAAQEGEQNPSDVLNAKRNPFNHVSQRAEAFGFKTCARYGSV